MNENCRNWTCPQWGVKHSHKSDRVCDWLKPHGPHEVGYHSIWTCPGRPDPYSLTEDEIRALPKGRYASFHKEFGWDANTKELIAAVEKILAARMEKI